MNWILVLNSVVALPGEVPRTKTNPPILSNDLQIDSVCGYYYLNESMQKCHQSIKVDDTPNGRSPRKD